MRFILRRLGFYAVAFWVSITLNFLLPRMMPGDPVSRMLSQSQGRLDPEDIEGLRKLLGVDSRPWWEQYPEYLWRTLTGDWGVSISRFPTPVSDVIAQQLPWTILLGLTSLIVAVIIGNLLGILAAWRRGSFLDSFVPPFLVFLGSFPYFWLAMGLLFLFGVTLKWAPLSHAYSVGMQPGFNLPFVADVAAHLVLPVISIVLVSVGGWMLQMRNTMISTNSEDYILMAEAKGLRTSRIMLRYGARNAMLPAVTSIGMSVGFIVGGAMLTEVVFAYPGVGFQLFASVQALDYPLMQGLFLTITIAVLAANFLIDIVYVRLDPRVRVS